MITAQKVRAHLNPGMLGLRLCRVLCTGEQSEKKEGDRWATTFKKRAVGVKKKGSLAAAGYMGYKGSVFHRVIKGFMTQVWPWCAGVQVCRCARTVPAWQSKTTFSYISWAIRMAFVPSCAWVGCIAVPCQCGTFRVPTPLDFVSGGTCCSILSHHADARPCSFIEWRGSKGRA